MSFSHNRYLFIACISLVLSLLVAQHAASQSPQSNIENPKSGSESSFSHAETTAPETLNRPGGIDQLLYTGFRDSSPDADLFRKSAEHFQMGRWEQAMKVLRNIIKTYPNSTFLERAYFLLAKSCDYMFQNKISEHFMEIKRHYQDAINKFPNSVFVPDAMVSIGNRYLKLKNYYEALAYFNLVCENYNAYSAAPEAMFERGVVLALTKQPKEAIKSFKQVEQLYSETPFASKAKIGRGKALFDVNNFEHSLKVLDEVMTTQPNKVYEDPDILLYCGYNYYELGRLEEARDILCKVLNYYPDIESNHLILARIADSYREQGMEGRALKLYNMVLKRYPDSEGGLISRLRLAADIQKDGIEMLASAGVIEEIASHNIPAREAYKEIMDSHGDEPLSQLAGLRLALQQQKDKDYEGSVSTLSNILDRYPYTPLKEQIKSVLRTSVEAIFKIEQHAGNYEKIVGYYEDTKSDLVLEGMPNILLILGDAYSKLHLYDRAIAAFEKVGKSYTDQSRPATLLFGLGECFYNVKRLEEAQGYLNAFVATYPEDKRAFKAYYLIGDIMLKQKCYAKAIAAFDLAMQKDPGEDYKIDIILATAKASNHQRDYDRASRLLKRAIALMDHNKTDSPVDTYEAYQELGETYLKLGYDEQAVSAFENALKVSPKGQDDYGLQFRLAESFQRLREREKTEGILNRIIASGDPFWSRLAEVKIDEIEIDIRLENLDNTFSG